MSYKIGGTTVIDNNGEIDWGRLKNIKAVMGTSGNYTKTHNCGDKLKSLSGPKLERTGNNIRIRYDKYYGDCNCNCNCNCLCRD